MTRLPPTVYPLPALLVGAIVAAAPDQYQNTREALVERINAVRPAAGVKPVKLSAPEGPCHPEHSEGSAPRL